MPINISQSRTAFNLINSVVDYHEESMFLLHTHKMKFYSVVKKQVTVLCDNVDEPHIHYVKWKKSQKLYTVWFCLYDTLKRKTMTGIKKIVVIKGQECREVTDYKVSWENTLGWWDYILTVVLLYEYTHLLKFISFCACIFTVFKLYPNKF